MERSIERRNSRRFQVALPLLLRWKDGVDQYVAGQCANICHGGMLVLAARTPQLGAKVEIEFVLPPFGGVSRSTRMRCVGWVVRFEAWDPLKGFAVAGSFVGGQGQDRANEMPDEGF